MAAFTQMLASGMFERYPRLKCAVLEAGSNWIAAWLDRRPYRVMKHQTPIRHGAQRVFLPPVPDLGRSRRIGHRADGRAPGADYFIWAPTTPSTPRSASRELKERLAPLSEEARRRSGQNAARFYGWPVTTSR
jgi:hypothetical protein